MACTTSVFVLDDNSVVQGISAADNGALVVTPAPGIIPDTVVLADLISRTTAWKIGVHAGGAIYITAVPFNPAYLTRIALISPADNQWFLVVTKTGALQTISGYPAAVGPVVGQLFPSNKVYPPAVQPGGIGTAVTSPVQTDGEKVAMWVAGCGHWFNSWMIQSVAFGCGPSALVCCPLCGYIQAIFTPYDSIHSDQNSIIFA